MAKQPQLISELLNYEKLAPDDVLDTLKFYSEMGLCVQNESDIESIIDKSNMSPEQLKQAQKYLVDASENKKIVRTQSRLYYSSAAIYVKMKLKGN